MTPDTVAETRALLAAGVRPEPALDVSTWSDKHRILGSHSAEPGPWRTSRAPFLKAIMDALSPRSPVRRVVFMKSAQVGGTECGLNWLGFVIQHSPAPCIVVMPTVEAAKRFSRHKLDPMLESTPALRDRVRSPRSRDAGNTVQLKLFPGGILVLTGSNSAVGLRSMSCRFVMADEIDAWPSDVEGEGDPISLLEARARTFPRRKLLLISTPTIAGRSRIEKEYAMTDQRRFFLPCPSCAVMQVLEFERLSWTPGKPSTATYACASCGVAIPEAAKTKMLAAGAWRATNRTADDPTVAGFHLSALYAPAGWLSWAEIAKASEDAARDPALLKSFTNTMLGEPFAEPHDAPDWHRLRERQTDVALGVVPPGPLFLSMGVDIQRDRIEASVWGWGRGRRAWLVDHHILEGDTAGDVPWSALTALLARTWPTADGAYALPLAKVGVDTGFFTSRVYAWAKTTPPGRVALMKGGPSSNTIVSLPRSAEAIETAGKRRRRGFRLYLVHVGAYKSELYGALRLDGAPPGFPSPPGWISLPAVGDEFLRQLTAEAQVRKVIRGIERHEWVKVHNRNEALDCFTMARAAAHLVGLDRFQEIDWRALEEPRGIPVPPPEPAPVPPPADDPAAAPMPHTRAAVADQDSTTAPPAPSPIGPTVVLPPGPTQRVVWAKPSVSGFWDRGRRAW